MRTYSKRVVSFFMLTVMLLMPITGFSKDKPDILINLSIGKGNMTVNGRAVMIEAPYKRGNDVFVPLRPVLETLGAEVNWSGQGRINVVFRNISVDLKIGSKGMLVNQVEKELSQAPETRGITTMITHKFVEEYFGATIITSQDSSEIKIIQSDDGALSDLSFLVGSISRSRVGDSYYQWSVNIPKGSRIASKSFNSKYMLIENENKGFGVEISILVNSGKSLEDYYVELLENSYGLMDRRVTSSILNTGAITPYGEFLFNDIYGNAVIKRIYLNETYIYNVTITSFNEKIPEKLADSPYIIDIVNSFKLSYQANTDGIQDLTNIKFGFANYENYSTSGSGTKYLTWEMEVLPEWDILNNTDGSFLSTIIGTGNNEYLSVDINIVDDIKDITEIAYNKRQFYEDNFNPAYYCFMDQGQKSIGGYNSSNVFYWVRFGKSGYFYEENYIIAGNLLYTITIKIPQDRYNILIEDYHRVIKTFKPLIRDSSNIEYEIEKYNYDIVKNRIGKDSTPVDIGSKTYGWQIKMPGYWTRNASSESRVQTFLNSNSGGMVFIEAIENSQQDLRLEDQGRFSLMSITLNKNISLIEKSTIIEKGKTIRVYKYRLENQQDESYADIKIYIINSKDYSYCYISSLSDLCSSTKNRAEMDAIWNSFKVDLN